MLYQKVIQISRYCCLTILYLFCNTRSGTIVLVVYKNTIKFNEYDITNITSIWSVPHYLQAGALQTISR